MRYVPVVRRVILAGRDLIVRGRGVVSPALFRHDKLGNCLMYRAVVQRERNGVGVQDGRTSKSCRFKISESDGRASIRSRRALSASVILTSTFATVLISTGPRLSLISFAFDVLHILSHVLFILWEIFLNSVGWMNGVVLMSVLCGINMSSIIKGIYWKNGLRGVLAGILEDDFAAT